MVKILRIVNSMGIGGLERGIYNLTLKLDRNKFQHVFCCLNKKEYFGGELEKKGIKIYELHKKPGLGLNLIPKLRSIIKKEKPDIIHTHNTDPLHQGVLASLGLSVVRIHTDHNSFVNKESKKALFLNKILSFFVEKIICVSDSVKKDWIKKIGIKNKKLVTISNGTDINQFDIKINREKEKKKLGFKKDDKIIGIVARLSKEKDIFTLIKAFRLVNKKIIKSKLLIVGDGPLRKKLEEFAGNKNIEFLGMRKDIPQLMKVFDVFVLSSLSEGNSQTIREAMASSRPVVATNVGGNPELVIDGINGLLVPKKNPEELAKVLIKLLNDKKLREKIGKNGRERVEKYFTIEQQVEKYKKLYVIS